MVWKSSWNSKPCNFPWQPKHEGAFAMGSRGLIGLGAGGAGRCRRLPDESATSARGHFAAFRLEVCRESFARRCRCGAYRGRLHGRHRFCVGLHPRPRTWLATRVQPPHHARRIGRNFGRSRFACRQIAAHLGYLPSGAKAVRRLPRGCESHFAGLQQRYSSVLRFRQPNLVARIFAAGHQARWPQRRSLGAC